MDRNSTDRSLCYGIAEFCRDARICRSKLYDLLKEGRGPKTIKIGRRRLILADSAQRWLDGLELATDVRTAGAVGPRRRGAVGGKCS